MIPHLLLAVSDESLTQRVIGFITDLGYTFEEARSAADILGLIKDERFNILLIGDEQIPQADDDFLNSVEGYYPEILSVLICDSTLEEIDHHLRQKLRIQDVYSPMQDQEQLRLIIERTFEIYSLRRKSSVFEEKERMLFQSFLDTYDWKSHFPIKSEDSIAHTILRQMNIGFFHGGGIGSLLSTMSMLLQKAKLNEEKKVFEVPRSIFQLVKETYEDSVELAKCLSRAQSVLMESQKVSSRLWLGDLYTFVNECGVQLKAMQNIKKHKLYISKLPEIPEDGFIIFNREMMSIVFRELLTNAMKYSRQEDIILVLFLLRKNYLEMKFLNPAYPNENGSIGISGREETMVFEPFYRLNSVIDDNYKAEEFGYGLGLAVVQKIIDLHQANISIHTIDNRQHNDRKQDICVTIRFPLVARKGEPA